MLFFMEEKNQTMNNQLPQITSSEVQEWENKFKQSVAPQVTFNAQHGGYSMVITSDQSGVDTTWSGTITVNGDNNITWTFSLKSEPFIECKMKLTEESKNIIGKLYDFYNAWKQEWSTQLTNSGGENTGETNQNLDGAATGNAAAVSGAPTNQGAATMPVANGGGALNENARNKENIIKNHRDRMLRLAQLK